MTQILSLAETKQISGGATLPFTLQLRAHISHEDAPFMLELISQFMTKSLPELNQYLEELQKHPWQKSYLLGIGGSFEDCGGALTLFPASSK